MTRTAILIACGLAAGPIIGGLVSGMDRILTARMQSRIGPPVLQPFYDVVKLLFKEPLVVNVWQAFCAYCYIAPASTALVVLFLQSDLLLIFFVQAVGAVFLVVGALSSTSPYSQIRTGGRTFMRSPTRKPIWTATRANNLAEFLRSTDPRKDDRNPSLATTEFRVYAGGTTLLGLRAVDVDSPAAAIQYTVAGLPEGGRVRLRNAASGGAEKDLVLGLHAAFTQADVNAGRVVFAQEGESLAGDTSLVVTLRDEDPAHGVTTNRVRLVAYEPAPLSGAERQGLLDALPWRVPRLEDRLAADQARLAGFLLSREFGYVVWDGSTEADPWQVKVPSS